nr:hypothetical protein [uncultured Hyphomonas sp.]
MTLKPIKIGGYGAGHPWFYVLGGRILPPSIIMAEVRISGYCGYMELDIAKADSLAEPKRSAELRRIRKTVLNDLRKDLSGYRRAARAVHAFRREHPEAVEKPFHNDAHTSASLKYCHLFNDFAHLIVLDDLLAAQRDLFVL